MVVKTTTRRGEVLELNEKSVSKKQQRLFGMVRAAQKGEMENPSPEISKIASTVSKSDVKKMASTKHKGLPEVKESVSLVSVLHRLKEEGYPARIEGPQRGLGNALCPICGQMGCTTDHDAEEEVKEGVGETIKKGLKRHKKAVDAKKVKERKAPPYAALAAEHEPEGEMVEGSAWGLWKGDGKRKLPADKAKSDWNKIRKDRGDQKEFERAQEYIKKNPNFGKKNVKEEMVDEGITKELVRAGIKVGGKTGGKVVKTVIKKGGEELKNQAVKVGGELATDAAKKIGQKVKEKGKKVIGPVNERTLSSYIPSDRQGEAHGANLSYVKGQLKKKEDESTKNRGDLSKRDAGKMAKQRLHNKKIMSMGEAKVDAGKSPETKEKERNIRKFGVGHNVSGHGKLRRSLHRMNRGDKKIKGDKSAWTEMESMQYEAKVDKGIPDYKRATKRDERYGNPHGSHALGGGIRKDRRADHEARRGMKKEEVELTETSPNVTYQAKGGRKSGKLGKSSIYSIRGKDESKRDFRKSHVKDIKDGLLKKEEVEMTRKAYKKLHKDFKSDDPKNPRTTKYNPKTGGTESHPVKFVDEERNARKMNVRTKKTIGATIEKNAAAEAKRRANKTGEYKETPKKKRSLKKPSQLTRVTGGDTPKPAPKPKAKKVTPKKTPITKATVTKPEPKKKSTKKPAAMKKAVERKKEVIKQPEKKTSEKKTFKDFVSQGVKRHKKATQGARVFGKGVVAGAKKAIKFAKDVKKVVSEEVIVEGKVKKIAAMIKGLRKPKKPLPTSTGRDAGAIAAKRMRDKEHNKYVNFLDAPDD